MADPVPHHRVQAWLEQNRGWDTDDVRELEQALEALGLVIIASDEDLPGKELSRRQLRRRLKEARRAKRRADEQTIEVVRQRDALKAELDDPAVLFEGTPLEYMQWQKPEGIDVDVRVRVLAADPAPTDPETTDDLLALLDARCSQQTGEWAAAQARLRRHVNDFELIHKARDEVRRLRAVDPAPTAPLTPWQEAVLDRQATLVAAATGTNRTRVLAALRPIMPVAADPAPTRDQP